MWAGLIAAQRGMLAQGLGAAAPAWHLAQVQRCLVCWVSACAQRAWVLKEGPGPCHASQPALRCVQPDSQTGQQLE